MGEDVGVTRGFSEKKIVHQYAPVEIYTGVVPLYRYVIYTYIFFWDETFFIIDIDHHRLLDFIDILINGRISYTVVARLTRRWFRSLFF